MQYPHRFLPILSMCDSVYVHAHIFLCFFSSQKLDWRKSLLMQDLILFYSNSNSYFSVNLAKPFLKGIQLTNWLWWMMKIENNLNFKWFTDEYTAWESVLAISSKILCVCSVYWLQYLMCSAVLQWGPFLSHSFSFSLSHTFFSMCAFMLLLGIVFLWQ